MKFYMTLIIAVLGVGMVTDTVSAQDEINYTEMVEDLKVMCRIIDETMHETFENDYVKGGFFLRGGCQHLYFRGHGAMFLLEVQFPVTEKEMKIVKTEKKTDLWEKYEREVRHQRQPEEAVWVVDKHESYSKEKADKLKEKLAYLIGEYGSRIGQLESNDTISFVVFGYSNYTVDFEADFFNLEWRVAGDTPSHPRNTTQELREKIQAFRKVGKKLEEAEQKLEGHAEKENQDNDKIEELKEKIQALRAAGHELEETGRKLEERAEKESQNNDKKVINPRAETIIIEKEKDEEIEDLEFESNKMYHLRIPVPPSLPHGFRRKPATTMILTFKRSQLEGKKGTDWETLLEAAEIVEY